MIGVAVPTAFRGLRAAPTGESDGDRNSIYFFALKYGTTHAAVES